MANSQAVDYSNSPYGKTKLANWGVADKQLSNGRAWAVFTALFIFAIVKNDHKVEVDG